MEAVTENVVARVENARLVIRSAGEVGLDEEELLEAAGVSRDLIEQPEDMIEYRHVQSLWNAASRLSGDSFFGAHAAERLNLAAFGLVGFAVRSCADGHEAVERGIDYSRRYFPNTDFELAIESGVAQLRHRCPPRQPPSRHGTDYIFITFLAASRKFTGIDWWPLGISYQCSAASDLSEYERIYAAPLEFGAEWNSVAFDRELLDAPLAGSDPDLLSVLSSHVEEYLSKIPSQATLASRVRQALVLEMNGGDVSLDATAAAVGLDPGTLQRLLWEEGTSHRRLLDGTRGEVAQRYLREPGLSMEQISRSLGFDDPEAFAQAFERWTGTAPAAFRNPRPKDVSAS